MTRVWTCGLSWVLVPILGACSGSSSTGNVGGGGGGGIIGVPSTLVVMEDSAFDQINIERQLDGDVALVHDGLQRLVARAHSEDMRDRAFFSHVNPDGYDPFDRMAAAGITYSTAGENILQNSGSSDPATAAVVGWMNSPGHRANILNGQFTHSGLGVATDGNGTYWFTQVFTRPTGSVVLRSWSVWVDNASDDNSSSWSASGR